MHCPTCVYQVKVLAVPCIFRANGLWGEEQRAGMVGLRKIANSSCSQLPQTSRDKTQEAWKTRFEEAKRRAAEKGEDIKQRLGKTESEFGNRIAKVILFRDVKDKPLHSIHEQSASKVMMHVYDNPSLGK
jgi:hypothetical protein